MRGRDHLRLTRVLRVPETVRTNVRCYPGHVQRDFLYMNKPQAIG